MHKLLVNERIAFSIIIPSLGLYDIHDFNDEQIRRTLFLYENYIKKSYRIVIEATFLKEVRFMISQDGLPQHLKDTEWCYEKLKNLDIPSLEVALIATGFQDSEIYRQFAAAFFADPLFIKMVFPQGGFMKGEESLDYPNWDKPPKSAIETENF